MRKSERVQKPEFVSNNEQVHYIGRGIECQVFEIVKMKLVCKIYDTDNDAKYNYTLQRIAYRHGIGPEPMGLEKNYYFSRYVKSYEKMDSYSKLPKMSKPYFRDISKTVDYREFLDKIVDIFGGEWRDSHSGNIGVLFVNGIRKFMIIDFGIGGFIRTKLGRLLAQKLELSYD